MPSGWLVRRVAITGACALAGCAASTRAGALPPPTTRPSAPAASAVVVKVDPARRSGRIGAGFVGLSLESFDINSTLLDPTSTNIAALLSNLGRSRLRIGGTESGIYWQSDPATPKPSWAHLVVTDASFTRLAALAEQTGWRVDLGVGLAHFAPENAALEVADAASRLGDALASLEIGNEPDLFASKGLRPVSYGYRAYKAEIAAYRKAFATAAPGVQIAGPDTARSPAVTTWLDQYVSDSHANLAFVTQHGYATTRCGGTQTSIAELLSAKTRARRHALVDALVASARRFHLTARLDETNSTSCGGQAGVSDRFASALWVVDDLLDAARRGVAGVNVHGLLEACVGYTPICADHTTGQLRAQPVYYGLLLVHAVGAGQYLAVTAPVETQLGIYAVRRGDGSVAVVAVNRDAKLAKALEITGVGTGAAGLLTLAAPSLAGSDATFGGARVGVDGFIAPVATVVDNGPTGYRIDLRPGSVALLTIPT